MFQLIDTLYITETEVQLGAQDGFVVIQLPDGVKTQIPTEHLARIICFDFPGISSAALRFLAEKAIRVYLVRSFGESVIEIGETPKCGGLWQIQQQFAGDSAHRLQIAKSFVLGRTLNCRALLQKSIREHREAISRQVLDAVGRLQTCCKKIEAAQELPLLLEEGKRAHDIYYSCTPELLLAQKQDFISENGDSPAASSRFTALRSFLYTLLAYDVTVAIESCGLNPASGFLHQEENERHGLVLDIVSELSPFLADRVVFSLINLRQIRSTDFIIETSGQARITEDAKRNMINAWQNRKQETLVHPYLNTKITAGMIPQLQGVLLTRYLRQELDGYPPFLFG